MIKDDFEFLYIIGKGGFGNVWKVKDKATGKYFALKQMEKAKIIDQNSERNILQERLFLAKMNSPFLVNMLCSFQDKDNLYLVLQLFTGGDLRYHLTYYNYSFTETQIKFLLSNIILGIQYLHSKGILHRDLKPENILFDDKGYAYITDFGIAWSNDEDHEGDNSGTPAYMAPETLFGLKQDYCVDFYSLGVIGYEIIMGKTPYDGNSRYEIRKQMQERNVYIEYDEAENFSDICIDFVNGLLAKNPEKRLGVKSGISQIKDNIFFRGINWEIIYQHKYLSPLQDIIKFSKVREGEIDELFDMEYCKRSDSAEQSTLERYTLIRNGKYYSKYFRNYSIICVDNILREIPKKKKVQIIKRVPVNGQNNINYGQLNNNIIMNNKMLKRSKSIADNIEYPNINLINKNADKNKRVNENNYHYHGNKIYKNLSQSNIKKYQDLKLPKINNKLLKKRKEREKKIKHYYEGKIGKYKTVLKKLHSNYLEKAKELNKQNKIFKEKKYKLLEQKYDELKKHKLLEQKYQNLKNYKTVQINNNPPPNFNNMNYNGYMQNMPNNNCNFCNCYNHCNCNNYNCCNTCNHCNNNCNYNCNLNFNSLNSLNQFDYINFYEKMNKNRDNFFAKFNNGNDSEGSSYNYEGDHSDDESVVYVDSYDRDLYEQNLIERDRIIPIEINRNRMRYITMGRDGPYMEVMVSSSDGEEEEEEMTEEIEIPEPQEERPPPRKQVIEKKIPEIRIKKIRYKPKIKIIESISESKTSSEPESEPKSTTPKKTKPKKKKEKPKKEKTPPKKKTPPPKTKTSKKKKMPKKKKTPPKKETEPEESESKPESENEPEKEPESEPKKVKVSSVVCSTCSRKLTVSSESNKENQEGGENDNDNDNDDGKEEDEKEEGDDE